MGDLGLGKSFNMMTSEQNWWIPDLLETSMAHVGPTSPIPWMAPILHRLPKAGNGSRKWLEFVGSQVQERLKKKSDRSDVRLSSLTATYHVSYANLNLCIDSYPPCECLRGDSKARYRLSVAPR